MYIFLKITGKNFVMKLITFTEYFLAHKQDFDAILFDIDGTLCYGGTPLPGAKELLELLEKEQFPYVLLTNDSCNSCKQKSAIMQNAGLPVPETKILSAGNALKYWADRNYHGELFFQCGDLGNYAELAGIKVTRDPAKIEQCKGVLSGEGKYDWQESMEAVFNHFLAHPEHPYITANPDSYWPSLHHSGMGIGAGAQTRFICAVLKDAGKEIPPIYLGKPYAPIYQCALPFLQNSFPGRKFEDMGRLAMVGDSLASDIYGANRNGLFSCLVLSGITTAELAEKAPAERKPQAIFKSV